MELHVTYRIVLSCAVGGSDAHAFISHIVRCRWRRRLVASRCFRRGQGASAKAVRHSPGLFDTNDIAEEAYIYAFPMVAAYKATYEFNVDKTSSQYKGPFNQIPRDAQVFTPKDTAIVTPNSDTPYSMLQLDLRAEPMIFGVPGGQRVATTRCN